MVVGSSCSYHPVPVPPEAPGSGDCAKFIATRGRRWVKAIRLLCDWAAARRLVASETQYLARTSGRRALRFSKSGDPTIERTYRTHWVSGALSNAQRKRLTEKANRAPELVVIKPLNTEWTCHRCGRSGDFLVMEAPPPARRACAASVSTI